ncbi:MAG: FGGY family carbohydrate kinase, partial [Pseudomonadota bacterium]
MYLGLDLGTSALKAMLIDEAQAVRATASAPLTVTRPHPGWSEQDPGSWITAAKAVLGEADAGDGGEERGMRRLQLSKHGLC